MTKYQDLPVVEPTDPLWVEDEFCSLDDAIERFFEMPDTNPDEIRVWPAERMPKPTLTDLDERFDDYTDDSGELDPLVERACTEVEKVFREMMAAGEISMHRPNRKARINWRDLPGADEYIAWRESKENSNDTT